MNTAILRKYIIKGLIGCLVAAAAVAIISILVGSLTDIASRTLVTVGLVAVHAVLFLALLPAKPVAFPRTALGGKQAIAHNMLVNVIMALIAADFLTSTLGVWDIITPDAVFKFMSAYFVVLVATVFAKPVYSVELINTKLHNYAIGAYILIATYALLSVSAIFEPTLVDLGSGFYGRLISAVFVSIVTLLVIIAIKQRLFKQQHAAMYAADGAASHHSAMHPIVIALLIIGGVVVLPFALGLLAVLFQLLRFY